MSISARIPRESRELYQETIAHSIDLTVTAKTNYSEWLSCINGGFSAQLWLEKPRIWESPLPVMKNFLTATLGRSAVAGHTLDAIVQDPNSPQPAELTLLDGGCYTILHPIGRDEHDPEKHTQKVNDLCRIILAFDQDDLIPNAEGLVPETAAKEQFNNLKESIARIFTLHNETPSPQPTIAEFRLPGNLTFGVHYNLMQEKALSNRVYLYRNITTYVQFPTEELLIAGVTEDEFLHYRVYGLLQSPNREQTPVKLQPQDSLHLLNLAQLVCKYPEYAHIKRLKNETPNTPNQSDQIMTPLNTLDIEGLYKLFEYYRVYL